MSGETDHHYLRMLFGVVCALIAYEWLLRSWLVGKVREALHQRSHRYAEAHDIRVDPFKYGGRLLVKEELLNDPQVNEAMREAARGGPPLKPGKPPRPPRPPEEVRRDVEAYIDEIVPAFSLTAYYQFGMALAKAAILAVYRPVIDRASQERLRALPKDATAVYLINHRSNFDYVVVGWALARQVALSYAVGEWARVFPLDVLFKAFGGFFVRRGFPDPLYHNVLRRYLQLITRRGVTQGIFPEGGLTRDGALRTPKVGLLDALIQLTAEPGYERELIFVPVGINYDRVLEDEQLLAEKRGRESPPTLAEKLLALSKMLLFLPFRIGFFFFRLATGGLPRGGYVAVAFGHPLKFSDWAKRNHIELATLSAEARRNAAKQVAADLMIEISRVIPATPVPLVARAMLQLESPTREKLNDRVRELRTRLDALGVPVALGAEFKGTQREQAELNAADHRNRDMSRLTGDMLESEEAESIARLGLEQLTRRGLVLREGTQLSIAAGESTREVLAYYSNSLSVLDAAKPALPAGAS